MLLARDLQRHQRQRRFGRPGLLPEGFDVHLQLLACSFSIATIPSSMRRVVGWLLPRHRIVSAAENSMAMRRGLRGRGARKFAGLSTYLYVKMNESGERLGYKWDELSWALEDSGPVKVGIKFMGGKICKRYRLYERDVA